MARRTLAALAEETPQRSLALAQITLALGDWGDAAAGDGLEPAIRAWSADATPTTFVFENAEALDHDRCALELVAKLLANRPDSRAVIICSRVNLRLNLARFAAARDIFVLHAADLLFDRDELRAVFHGLTVDAKVIQRALELSRGWPIGAQILRSIVSEPDAVGSIERLEGIRFEDLFDYLSAEVLRSCPTDVLDALVACAALPEASAEDVSAVLGSSDAEPMLDALVAESPFLSKTAQYTYVVHPLMRATLLARHADKMKALPLAGARAWLARKGYVRAAELFTAGGDRIGAARALDRIEVMETSSFSASYARALASLDASTFAEYLRLFASSMNYRQYFVSPQTLKAETESVWHALPRDMPIGPRAYVDYFRIEFSEQLGELETARRIVDQLFEEAHVPDMPENSLHAHVLLYRGVNAAKRGRLTQGERLVDAAWPHLLALDQVLGASGITRAALIPRVRGQREVERSLLEESLVRCRRAGISCRIARAYAEITFGAWFAGDDAEFARGVAGLLHSVEADGVLGFAHFLNCARGIHEDPPRGIETPAWLAQAQLIACAASVDARAAQGHARAALEASDRSGLPFLRVLSRLAAAEKLPSDSARLRSEAIDIARSIDSPELAAAVSCIVDGAHAGMLESFVARLRARKPPLAALCVDYASGTVRCRGRTIMLRPRELRLLMVIARSAGPITAERLTHVLWPDADDRAARNALKTTLHRLRKNLGDSGLVVTSSREIGLRERADIDLMRIELAVRIAGSRGPLTRDTRARLFSALDDLRCARPPSVQGWDWYESLDRQMVEWGRVLATRLAALAFDSHEYAEALRLASSAIEVDPYDEEPQELAVRALLALGDHAAALRMYRDYRNTLKIELDTVPTASFEALVKDVATLSPS